MEAVGPVLSRIVGVGQRQQRRGGLFKKRKATREKAVGEEVVVAVLREYLQRDHNAAKIEGDQEHKGPCLPAGIAANLLHPLPLVHDPEKRSTDRILLLSRDLSHARLVSLWSAGRAAGAARSPIRAREHCVYAAVERGD